MLAKRWFAASGPNCILGSRLTIEWYTKYIYMQLVDNFRSWYIFLLWIVLYISNWDTEAAGQWFTVCCESEHALPCSTYEYTQSPCHSRDWNNAQLIHSGSLLNPELYSNGCSISTYDSRLDASVADLQSVRKQFIFRRLV